MPIPLEYMTASQAFDAFMEDARAELDLATRHMAYGTVRAVLIVFRRRLTPQQVLAFGEVLPAVLRALLVSDWELDTPPVPFADLADMNAEVQAIRPHHTFSPDDSVARVATALLRHVDQARLRAVLSDISPDALAFWQLQGK